MRSRKSQLRNNRWENAIIFTITLLAGIVVISLGAPKKWLGAVFVTVVLFAGILSMYTQFWKSQRFWLLISGFVLLHVPLMWVVFGMWLRAKDDAGIFVCLPCIFVEGFLVYYPLRWLLGLPNKTDCE